MLPDLDSDKVKLTLPVLTTLNIEEVTDLLVTTIEKERPIVLNADFPSMSHHGYVPRSRSEAKRQILRLDRSGAT